MELKKESDVEQAAKPRKKSFNDWVADAHLAAGGMAVTGLAIVADLLGLPEGGGAQYTVFVAGGALVARGLLMHSILRRERDGQ